MSAVRLFLKPMSLNIKSYNPTARFVSIPSVNASFLDIDLIHYKTFFLPEFPFVFNKTLTGRLACQCLIYKQNLTSLVNHCRTSLDNCCWSCVIARAELVIVNHFTCDFVQNLH